MKEKALKRYAHFISILLNIVCIVFGVLSVFSVFKMAFSQFFMSGLFALVLFCISLIFDYGCELQQEVDETL